MKSDGQEIISLELKTGFDLRKDDARPKKLGADISLDDAILKEEQPGISAGAKNSYCCKAGYL